LKARGGLPRERTNSKHPCTGGPGPGPAQEKYDSKAQGGPGERVGWFWGAKFLGKIRVYRIVNLIK